MKTEGLDRVIIGVRDIDKAVKFFSEVVGAKFVELKGPMVEAIGERACISYDKQLELVSPVLPLKDDVPPMIKALAKILETRECVLLGLSYRVKDPDRTALEADSKGVRIVHKLETNDFADQGMRNLQELIAHEEDTLGMLMTFIKYDRP